MSQASTFKAKKRSVKYKISRAEVRKFKEMAKYHHTSFKATLIYCLWRGVLADVEAGLTLESRILLKGKRFVRNYENKTHARINKAYRKGIQPRLYPGAMEFGT